MSAIDNERVRQLRTALMTIAAVTGTLLVLGIALDLPAALGGGFFSDCATYYALANSLAHDFDLEYNRSDLQRIYNDFSGGPAGIFLQRNPDNRRLYYGKAYIYPMVLAPAVKLFGHRGVLITHALLMGFMLLGMTLLWERRWGAMRALWLGLAFVIPSVASVYYFWIAPEFFNFALIFAAYFLWLYKEVNPRENDEDLPRWRAALLGSWTDIAGAALLGIATYSKLTNGVLALPLLIFLLLRLRWLRLGLSIAAFAAATLLLFGLQTMATGNWNYQGGERKSFTKEFPFANGKSFDSQTGTKQETNLSSYKPPFDPNDVAHNLLYFLLGRFGGIVPYYFPAALALVLFLAVGRRLAFRWLVLGGALISAMVYIILIPTNIIGGGGTVGNRYFMNILPLFFFLLPERTPRWSAAAALLGGALFAGHIIITPLSTSAHPAKYAETPVLRLLPVEYTMLNDLPINTNRDRTRVPWYKVTNGKVERNERGERMFDFFLYQLDHNSYYKEPNPYVGDPLTSAGTQHVWTIGGKTAELIVRTVDPLKKLRVRLTNSNTDNTIVISVQGSSRTLRMKPKQKVTLDFHVGPGFAYHYLSTSYIYPVTVSTSKGVTPRTLPGGANDWRHLGVMLEFWTE